MAGGGLAQQRLCCFAALDGFRAAHVEPAAGWRDPPVMAATEPAPVRQILEHVGERTTTPSIAPACSPALALSG